jgi:tRNA(Arg) A34 adenosine deaminase TadA
MKSKYKIITGIFLLALCNGYSQSKPGAGADTVENKYFVTIDRAEYIQKVCNLIPGVHRDDSTVLILKKMETFLSTWHCDTVLYPDDNYARESNLQALKSVQEGGYGIGAVLIDASGRIIERAHNDQIQKHRSDLHGEMALLTAFEESPQFKKYANNYVYKPGLTVFSSAEPCPMCFIRLATVGVETKYCTPGPDDGMVSRIDCLPGSWRDLASRHSFRKAKCSPRMQKMAHLLFFSFLLDGRGPK